MECLHPVCWIIISIFLANGLYDGVDAKKPIIYPKENEITIQEGEELKIECHSHDKVKFSTQQFLGDAEQSKFETSFDEDSNTYTFIRRETVRQDTGWYACANDWVQIQNDEQTIDHPNEDISWIYVYVKSPKPFAIDHILEFIVTMTGRRVVIPCRTTSPDFKVELEINYADGSVENGTIYDPKIGFIIPHVAVSQRAEYYTCKIEEFDQNATIFPSYILSVTDPQELTKLVINKEKLRHVVWGKDLTLECSITVSGGTNVDLKWKAPRQVDEWRLHNNRNTTPEREPGAKRTLTAYLTVESLEADDQGDYVCTAESVGTEHTTESSITFPIWDPNITYLNVTLDAKNNSLELIKGDTAVWKMTVDAYPENINFTWIKSDRENIIQPVLDEREKYSYTPSGNNRIFRIAQLDLDDNGNYTLNFFNEHHQNQMVHLSLTVNAIPTISISKNSTSYPRGHFALFSCIVTGSPLPDISWSYIEYPDLPSEENFVQRNFSNIEVERLNSDRFTLASVLNVTMNMTGDLICRSCNRIGCTEAKNRIYVSDADFGIDGLATVTVEDNVTLTCFASRRNFTNNISWKFENASLPEYMNTFDTGSETKSRSTLVIHNVSLHDGGLYSCHAECKSNGWNTVYHKLDVLTAAAPRITNTNLNNSKIVVKVDKNNREMTFKCFVEGRPNPTITWHKGSSDALEENDQFHFLSNNSTLLMKLYGYEDSGVYTCRAENRYGSVEQFIDMTVEGRLKPQSNAVWVSLIGVLIVIIVLVITYMIIKVRREKRLRKELMDAGLTHFRDGALECLNPDLTIDEQAELLPYDKKWEFPREQLKLGKQLGSGAFGVVMKAEARGICVEGEVTTVAVKMVRRTADPSYMKALSSELKIMIHLGRHLNVVNLLGACTKSILTKRELYVIVEYCHYGNLHNYLQRHRDNFIDQIDPATQKIDLRIGMELLNERISNTSQNRSKYSGAPFSPSPSTNSSSSNSEIQLVDFRSGNNFVDINMSPDGGILSNNSVQPGWRSNYRGDYKDQNLKPICTQDLLCWAWQVSRGMEYLSSRNVLHGDLAARNILLADDNIVKICDFGLAKNMYKDANYKKQGDGPLPLKWMAIESIRDRIFSTQSDVWSFGIVLWEFFTLSRSPYPGMEAEKQYDRLVDGYRMEKPEYATEEIYDFMLDCWRANPALRPSFHDLAEKIGSLVNERTKMHYFNLSTPYMNMNAAALENGKNDYLSMMSAPNHNYYNTTNAQAEVNPESAYVSMNRMKPPSQTGIFSPRSELEESHFNFPDVSNQTVQVNSSLDNDKQTETTSGTQNHKAQAFNSQELRNQFLKHSNNRDYNAINAEYCNIPKTNNPPLSEEQSETVKNSDENPNRIKSPSKGTNSKESFAVSESNGHDRHYKNTPRQRTNLFENQKTGSHGNARYTPKNENNVKRDP